MRRDLLAAVLVCALAALIPPAVAQAGVTRVQAGTRVLLLDGKPWSPVGYSYSPTPVGSAFTPVSYDAASCERDGATMAAAGVNLVRMGLGSTGASPAAPGLKACVAALAGHGVGVAWTLVPPPGTPTAQWLEAYRQDVTVAVDLFKDAPGTRMWLINNEQEIHGGGQPQKSCIEVAACMATWFGARGGSTGMLDDLVQTVKSLDPSHLVGTSVSMAGCLSPISGANAPHLDLWAFNDYPDVTAGGFDAECGGLFARLDAADPRPKLVSEFGADRFQCASPLRNGDLVVACARAGSGERQDLQAQWLVSLWSQIKAHLASSASPQGSVSGGIAFMYSDNWDWCTAASFRCDGMPPAHDLGGGSEDGMPDGIVQPEWFGVAYAQPASQDYARLTTAAFHDLAAQWGHRAPDIVAGSLSVDRGSPCVFAGASWTTSEPATSEVYTGVQAIAGSGTGQALSDDTIFSRAKLDAALTTTHGLPFQVPAGATTLVVVRSETADGRVVTSAPRAYVC